MTEPALAAAAPRLPAELSRASAAQPAHDARCVEVELRSLSLAGVAARGVSLEESVLVELDASAARLEALRLLDCAAERCDFANALAPRASFVRASFRGSRMTGVQLTESTLRDVSFHDCRIDLASFARARLQRVSFEDCLLSHSDFLDCELDSVRFVRCELIQADFRGARLARCELRRCKLAQLRGLECLRGAAMEWPDILEHAGELAAALGIGVLDEPP